MIQGVKAAIEKIYQDYSNDTGRYADDFNDLVNDLLFRDIPHSANIDADSAAGRWIRSPHSAPSLTVLRLNFTAYEHIYGQDNPSQVAANRQTVTTTARSLRKVVIEGVAAAKKLRLARRSRWGRGAAMARR